MNDKRYLNEKILKSVLQKLDELKQQSKDTQTVHVGTITCLVEQAQQHV